MSRTFFLIVTILCFVALVIGFFWFPVIFIVAAPLLCYNCLLLIFIEILKRRKPAAEAAAYLKNVMEDD